MADESNHRVQVYQFSGATPVYSTTIGVSGESGSDNTHLNGPTQVAFDSSGKLYILDTGNERVQRCTFAGGWTCQTLFGETGVGGDDLMHLGWPFGMMIDRNDNLYLVDSGNQRVLKCTLAGARGHFAGVTGQIGADNAHLNWPGGVAMDSHGTLFVADGLNHRIQKFTSAGAYAGTIGVTSVPLRARCGPPQPAEPGRRGAARQPLRN